MNKYFLAAIVGLFVLGIYSCKDGSKTSKEVKVSTGDELIGDNVEIGDKAYYDETPEDESTGMDRAFENAPPLIPHTVKGMEDIHMNDNECLLCHMPDKAENENATPIPKSHFMDYRPKITQQGEQLLVDAEENEVVQADNAGKLDNSRFFCNQCHVPQTDATLLVGNVFKPSFRKSSDKSKSNLDKNIGEGVK
ncbi:MAG: nitrate reductase cytochrome c-type subunit [Bacteroidota bacterium]